MKRKFIALALSGLLLAATPTFSLANQAPLQFGDIQGHWAEQAILDISGLGIMQGIGSNEQGLLAFAPEMQVTRAQTAAVMTAAFKLDLGSVQFIRQPLASDYYRDVDIHAWYANAVLKCAFNRIFSFGDYFYPEQAISRIEMAQAVKSSFDVKGYSIPMIMSMPVFEDMEGLSSEQVNALAFVNNTGIMIGENGYFRPNAPMSRAELAQILQSCMRVMNLNVDNTPAEDAKGVLDEDSNGKEFTVPAGQEFILSLDSNPTTGYEWMLSESYDKSVIELQETYYEGSKGSPVNVLGQGGRSYWKFTPLKEGTTELKLTYSRPWESVQPAQQYAVKISVTAGSSQELTDSITSKINN